VFLAFKQTFKTDSSIFRSVISTCLLPAIQGGVETLFGLCLSGKKPYSQPYQQQNKLSSSNGYTLPILSPYF
jgi:hypothetical protein